MCAIVYRASRIQSFIAWIAFVNRKITRPFTTMTFGVSARRITESVKSVARSLFCNPRRRDDGGSSSGPVGGAENRTIRPMSAEDRVRIMGLPQGREFKLNPELDDDVLQIT